MPKLFDITQASSKPSPKGDEKTFTFFLTTFTEPYKRIVPTQTDGTKMNKTEMYRQQLRQLRSNFYAKDKPTIQEMMEFAQEEIYLVKKMSGKF